MKNLPIVLFCISISAFACRALSSLTSTTYIGPRQSFVLGQGKHGAYTVSLKNKSRQEITIRQIALDGTLLNSTVASPAQSLVVDVAQNTTLEIVNATDKSAEVALKIKGDTNLSMGYNGK
jgi:hypothetical protein